MKSKAVLEYKRTVFPFLVQKARSVEERCKMMKYIILDMTRMKDSQIRPIFVFAARAYTCKHNAEKKCNNYKNPKDLTLVIFLYRQTCAKCGY